LASVGQLPTLGEATDLAPEANGWLWVAEGDAGVRLYDMTNPAAPLLLLWLNEFSPASAIRLNGAQIVVGYGSRLAILSTVNVKAPTLIGTIDLGKDAPISDLIVQGTRLYAAQLSENSPDIAIVDLTNPKTPNILERLPGGDRLSLYNGELLTNNRGVQRLHLGDVVSTPEATVQTVNAATGGNGVCTLAPPSAPQPPNLSEFPAGSVTLTWKSACSSATYELRVNGIKVASLNTTSYTFTPPQGITMWQVSALDSAGNRVDGPQWSFESTVDGPLATPASIPHSDLLYTLPPVVLGTPRDVVIATIGSIVLGLGLIVGVGYMLGQRIERRAAAQKEKANPMDRPL
jgi:hypothetical protein